MGTHKRLRREKRTSHAGFSLIEAMVATGVLGIALAALVGLHTSAMRGTVSASRLGDATEVARALADHYALRTFDTPTNCAPTQAAVLPAIPGCAGILAANASRVCASPQHCDSVNAFAGANCISDVDPRLILNPAPAQPPPPGPAFPGRFRVQLLESSNFGAAVNPGLRITVVVCWNDGDSGAVRTVTSTRLSVPGL